MLVASLLLSFVMVAPATAKAADASIVKAFIRCNNEFFDVLRSERAKLGQVSVRPFRTGPKNPFGRVVTFSNPLTEFGLSFVRYRQLPTYTDADFRSWTWGLEVAAKPSKVVLAFDRYMKREWKRREGLFPQQGHSGPYWAATIGAENDFSGR